MNDASNVIITNHQSDITRIKFGQRNNKITNVVNVTDIVQKNNQLKLKNNNINKTIENNKENQKKDFCQNKKSYNNNDKTKINQKEQKILNTSISFIEKNYYFLKLSRYCSLKVKIIILALFLICSFLFLGINLYDYIIYWKYEKNVNKELLSNNLIIFLLQLLDSLGLLFFLCIIFFLNQGENHNFIIASFIFIIIFSSLKIYIFIKHIKISLSILLNLIYSIIIFLISIILFLIVMLMNKKKENVLQNIDEIVYFTENNMPTQKKEKDINYMNNSPNNNILKKEAKSAQLVEEDNENKNKNELK